jgi:TPR repeat protein
MLVSSVFAASGYAYLRLRQHGTSLLASASQIQAARGDLCGQVGPIAAEPASDKTAGSASATALSKFPSEPSTRFAWERVERKGRPKALPPVLSPMTQPATGGSSAQPRPTRTTLSRLAQLWASTQAGDATAAAMLADLYLRGDGVPVDCDQARALLFVASKENNAEATKKLLGLNETGCPVP